MSWDDDFFTFDFFINDDHSQKRGGRGNWHSSKSSSVHENRNGKLFWIIFFLTIAAFFIFMKSCEENDYMAIRREKAAINRIDMLLSKPYYVHKSDFEAQKDKMHPALQGLQIGMPPSSKEMKNSFHLSGYESEDSIMGTTSYFFSGNYEDGKLQKMTLQLDYNEDGKDMPIVERIRNWAGKGCYVTYNTYERKNEYKWQYKNAIIKLIYSDKTMFLILEQPELDIEHETTVQRTDIAGAPSAPV